MFETIAVVVVLLLGSLLVFAKARERLKQPGARRSRRKDGDGGSSHPDGQRHDDGDAGDGGGDGDGGD